jgi:hypothetical protein
MGFLKGVAGKLLFKIVAVGGQKKGGWRKIFL